MRNHLKTGKLGENMACGYLVKKMFKILKRNYREGFDEIDIIARSFDQVIVFLRSKPLGNPLIQ